jgi:putative ABC transport system permease protein
MLRRRRHDHLVLRQELSAHLEALEEEYRSRGLSVEAAYRAARVRLGNVTTVHEDVRDEFLFGGVERLAQDLRYAFRTLRANPGFAFFTVVIMALGIGATTTMFSIVNGVLLRPLRFREPARLVMLEERWLPRFPRFEASPLDFVHWQQDTRSFSDLAAFKDDAFILTSSERPERLAGARVSANLPSILGVDPVMGRSFSAADDQYGSSPVVLLGDALWRRRFGADPGVIGRAVTLNGLSYTIIGVMPSTFRFPENAEVWTPIQFTPKDLAASGNHSIWAIARLKDGVTYVQAQAEMDLLMPRLQAVWTATVVPLTEHYVGDIRRALYVLLGAAGLVLLIASVNIAGILVARGSSRQREVAMRAAIGASGARIVQQLLIETTAIAVIGGALGVLLAYLGIGLLKTVPLISVPRLEEVTLSPAVLALSVCVSILTGIVFGIAPAWRLSRENLNDSLKAGGRMSGSGARPRLRSALVAVEVGLAVVLLAGAGVLLKSLAKLLEVSSGIQAANVLTAAISLPTANYPEPHDQARFVTSLLTRLERLPGVRAAAISTGLPFASTQDSGIRFEAGVEGTTLSGTTANHYRVTPAYFRVMQIPLVRGRLLTDTDTPTSLPVVLINETMARRFFPDEDPIGQRLDISGPTYMRAIVGIVGDVRQDGLRRPSPPQVYEAFAQKPSPAFTVAMSTTVQPRPLMESLRQQVLAIDKSQPLSTVRTMEDVIGDTMTRDRMAAGLLGLFALLALMLAAIGIYGVIAYSVAQRTQEIGVRRALGADRANILALMLRLTMRPVVCGLMLGLVASMAGSRLLESLLYEVSPRDPVTLISTSILVLAVAFAAALVPAWRAVRIHPMVALRAE